MSNSIIFEQEIEFCFKKGKWKKCICVIQFIPRVKSTLCALIKEIENSSIIETIDIFGYKCGVNTIEFVFIGRKNCYSIRFKDLDRMIELEKILKEYINDVNYFVQLDDCKKGDCILTLKDWYRFHVQINRICLTTDKSNELIKIWNIFRIGEIILTECYLSVEVKSGKDCGVYKFHHDAHMVLKEIYNALMERKLELPFIKIDQNYLMKRRSELIDLKRFNSCSNSREMKKNHRVRALSSSETNEFDYDVSMPSTPAYINSYDANLSSRKHDNINEYVEHSLVFQMDSLDCGSVDSSGVYSSNLRCKTNSEGYDTISTESDNKNFRKVGLEKFPFEAEIKNKTNISPPCAIKDSYCQPHNRGIISRPNNGKCYQTLTSLRNQHKTLSDVNLVSGIKQSSSEISYSQTNEKKENYREKLTMYSDKKCSSSSFLHTPSPSSNISYENQSILVPMHGNGLNSNYITSIYKENQFSLPNQSYYNLSNHITPLSSYHSNNNHQYFNLINTLQSDPVDIKPKKDEEKKLNYVTIDFSDSKSYSNPKVMQNFDNNYKEIDIKNTEALKSLDAYSFPKTQKKGLFKMLSKYK